MEQYVKSLMEKSPGSCTLIRNNESIPCEEYKWINTTHDKISYYNDDSGIVQIFYNDVKYTLFSPNINEHIFSIKSNSRVFKFGNLNKSTIIGINKLPNNSSTVLIIDESIKDSFHEVFEKVNGCTFAGIVCYPNFNTRAVKNSMGKILGTQQWIYVEPHVCKAVSTPCTKDHVEDTVNEDKIDDNVENHADDSIEYEEVEEGDDNVEYEEVEEGDDNVEYEEEYEEVEEEE
jgi:hypothetical protein